MSDKNTGGPAFPTEYREDATQPCAEGMTLRDYFACKAMQAFCSDSDWSMMPYETARAAYHQADAMLKVREA